MELRALLEDTIRITEEEFEERKQEVANNIEDLQEELKYKDYDAAALILKELQEQIEILEDYDRDLKGYKNDLEKYEG